MKFFLYLISGLHSHSGYEESKLFPEEKEKSSKDIQRAVS